MTYGLARMADYSRRYEAKFRQFCLTPRETEIAVYWLLDYDYKQIGNVLGISSNTVRTYIQRIYLKTDANSKVTLLQALSN